MNDFLSAYYQLPSQKINARYINSISIDALLNDFPTTNLGNSVEGRSINAITLGKGPIKVLMWSQMHGNETTSTKGLFDVLYYIKEYPACIEQFTLKIIPILNPDGAELFTRVNGNEVDLNRDAIAQTQPESRVLMDIYHDFNPDYCFNLHGQRTIFGVNGNPCMLSFLAPAADEAKTITKAREKAMGIIGNIFHKLQEHIPNQIGRYDDTFNLNCMGDYFMNQGTPTILFECGQVGEDYGREKTRKWFAFSLLVALNSIATKCYKIADYQYIKEVEKTFVDILLKNVYPNDKVINVAIHFNEVVREGKIYFTPFVHSMGDLKGIIGHKTIDLTHQDITFPVDISIHQDATALMYLLNLTQYSH